ncbi:MAG: hypothetical protein Q9183_001906 [Haloplaca sp. 2 TL-2023]
MGPKPASIFAGGWTAAKAAKLEKIELPEKTKCNRCHKVKAMSHFSNKQQLDLKHRIAGTNGEKAKSAIAEIITCRTCTGGPVNELTCCICGEVKGLDGFSKAQRKDPDLARCILCLHEQSEEVWAHSAVGNREPDAGSSDSDDDSDNDYGYDDTTTNAYSSASYRDNADLHHATSALDAVNLSKHDKTYGASEQPKGKTVATQSDLLGSYSDDDSTDTAWGKGKGKAKENDWQSFASKKSRKQNSQFTGFDSQGGAHRQVRAPSTVFSNDSVEITTSVRSGPSAQVASSRSKFAKIPAVRGKANMQKPDNVTQQMKAAAIGRTVAYHGDEDDSSGDDDWGTL